MRILFIKLLAVLLAAPVGAAQPPAVEILAGVEKAESFGSLYGEMKQIITTTSGGQRTLVLRSWALASNEKQLAEYLHPADIKGQRILMTDFGDNIWMFNPETRRTRKLGSHMRKRKVMGSDFTYEDQATGRMNERYHAKVLRSEKEDGLDCWVLELIPKPGGPSYGKIVTWIRQSDFVLIRSDYYREKEDAKPFKRLTNRDVRKVLEAGAGKAAVERYMPFEMTMTNLEDGTNTRNIITKIQLGTQMPESLFEARNLEKAR